MQESCHLVALNKSFSQRFPLFIVWLSILNTLTPSMVSWVPKQKPIWYLCLDQPCFCFSHSSFQVGAWSSSTHVHLHLHGLHHHAPSLGMYQPCTNQHLWQRLVLRFHQLSKTKLGLSISPFLVIDDNLFTMIFNKIFLDSCCLPKHITMCKGYGQVS